tara:strand:+ start:361 stop:669 length:309 start_codon:yes stop_codon:yes gene_type:complete
MAKKELTEEEKQRIRDMDASVTGKEGKLLSEKNFFEKLEFILGTDLEEYPTGVITALRDIVPNTKEGLRILREGKNTKKRTGDDSSDKYYGGNVYPRKPKSG